VGDGHICIPLCVGIFALYQTFTVPAIFQTGMLILFIATAVHLLFVALVGGLPRFMGWVLTGTYVIFVCKRLLGGTRLSPVGWKRVAAGRVRVVSTRSLTWETLGIAE